MATDIDVVPIDVARANEHLERVEFENWLETRFPMLSLSRARPRFPHHTYEDSRVELAWQTWRAAIDSRRLM